MNSSGHAASGVDERDVASESALLSKASSQADLLPVERCTDATSPISRSHSRLQSYEPYSIAIDARLELLG